MNIVVAGYGYVGKAYKALLASNHEVGIVDPIVNDIPIKAHKPKGVLCCVSTPEKNDGSCDITNVIDVIENTPDGVPILIKSTISIEAWDNINKTYPNKEISYSPEFLRESSYIEDVKKSPYYYIGGKNTEFWIDVFKECYETIYAVTSDPRNLIAVKNFRNAYLATKVSFFNQVYDFCESKGLEFTEVHGGLIQDPRVGESHTKVTDERGFGGRCFPKDTASLLYSAGLDDIELSILKSAVDYNTKIRETK